MKSEYFVIRKRDDSQVEVIPFEENQYKEALELYDHMQANWSECYLCKVVNGEVVEKSETRWFAGCMNPVKYDFEEFSLSGFSKRKGAKLCCKDGISLGKEECNNCKKKPIKSTIRYEITKDG